MELIDKDRIVAEIERRKKKNVLNEGAFEEDIDILSFINALETKEVDLKKEIQTWVEDNSVNGYYREDIYETAEHFFELGLKTKDWREERMKECPYRQVGCTMYSGTILECRGACSWVVDYPKLKELEEKKGE